MKTRDEIKAEYIQATAQLGEIFYGQLKGQLAAERLLNQVDNLKVDWDKLDKEEKKEAKNEDSNKN